MSADVTYRASQTFTELSESSDGTRQKISRRDKTRRDKKIRDETENWQKKFETTPRQKFSFRDKIETRFFKQISGKKIILKRSIKPEKEEISFLSKNF